MSIFAYRVVHYCIKKAMYNNKRTCTLLLQRLSYILDATTYNYFLQEGCLGSQ